ncbi:MAG TPA: hypothetical protein VGU20_20735 [Stellaceae bacterium]|nr:hypothetical protein [Stellaceae bacterium]
MQFLSQYVDASWVDVGSLVVALIYAASRYRKSTTQALISKDTGRDVLHGLALFPLILIFVGGLSKPVLTAVLDSNRLVLAVAGLVALLAILEEK